MAGKKRKAATEDSDLPARPATRRQSGRVRKTGLKYNDTPDATDVDSGSDFNDDHDDVEEEPKSKKSKANKNAKPSKNINTKARRLNDDKQDSETDEEELKREGWTKNNGKWEMVVELPGEKDPGDTPYEDHRVHPNTMEFLGELKENNRRDWLKLNDAPFRQAEKDFQTFVKTLSERMYEIDSTIPELPLKDVIFRIYRDLRFTNDPTPYKPHFSAVWSRGGRKGPYAHYYIQIQPGEESFIGGGYYAPDNTTLACIREDIDQQPHQFKSVLMNKKIRKAFFPGVKDKDEKKIVEAFCEISSVNALKTKPKDFAKDHPDIELLKLRSFLLHKKLSDDEIAGSKVLDVVAGLFEAIEPFVTYLNDVVLPDV